MSYMIPLLLLLLTACATSKRQPNSLDSAVTAPPSAFLLEQALQQGPEATVAYLKAQSKATPFDCIHPTDCGPSDLLSYNHKMNETNKDRETLLHFLRQFRPWSFSRKAQRSKKILEQFACTSSIEAQAMGLILERDFPETEAQTLSQNLHEKVIACNGIQKTESLLRLAIFTIQKNQCPQAMEYLKQLPPSPEQGVNDRVAYLQRFCSSQTLVERRNPWGGYGVRLGEVPLTPPENPKWYLSTASGSENWDRFLATILDLSEKGDRARVAAWASKLNFEKFRSLPHSFQASVLVLFHFADADLSVFQSLHRYLADHPDLSTREVVPLLFPARFWSTIVQNTKGIDPVLVKSLIRQESAFNPTARSRARALGLMQVIYPTARAMGVKNRQQLLEPGTNIRVGSEFLKKLITDFGSVEMALAAYNAGPEIVREWKKRYPTENIDLFVEMIPYTETREYVRLVLRNYKIYQKVLLQPEDTPRVVQFLDPALRP